MPDSERNVPLSHREDKPGCSCIPAFFLEAESISGRTSSKKAVAEYRIREFGREERLGSRLRSSLLRFYDNGMFLTPKDTRKAGTSSCWRDSGLHWTTLGSKFFEWWRRGESNPRPKVHPRGLLRAQRVLFIPSPARGRSHSRVR